MDFSAMFACAVCAGGAAHRRLHRQQRVLVAVADLHRHQRLLVRPLRAVACAILMMASAAALGSYTRVGGRSVAESASRESTTNPRQLRAMQLLDRRTPGVAPRVRFEWDPVSGARRYVLAGRWMSPPSWAIHSEEHRVTRQNATAWESHRVAFEVSLPEGTHSWSVVALLGPQEHGDFDHPTTVSFEVR